ncbi:MAG: UvrB/UvrC motif-containing protein [Verrucomicrobiota bacterium]
MGKEIKCHVCESSATVHLTQIIGSKIHKVNLCEECAQRLGVMDPGGLSVADLVEKGLVSIPGEELPSAPTDQSCSNCGYTVAQLNKTGRLGCSDCYSALESEIHPMLERMHSGTEHVGKVPLKVLSRTQKRRKVDKLSKELQLAIYEERYEDAAQLRDELKTLKEEESPVA